MIVAAYFVAGTLWVVGSGPVADMVTEATSVTRGVVEVGLGVFFVAITTLALSFSMRRRAARLESADASTQAAEVRTDDAESRAHEAEVRTRDTTRQLAASKERNRLQATALSGVSSAVLVTDRDGTIQWVNEAFETMSGYPASACVGSTPRLLKSGMQDEQFFAEMWETILAGRVWSGEVVNRRSDGELYTVSQTIKPVAAADGEVHSLVATCEDITEHVRAARDLAASLERLQSLVDHALDAIVLADDTGRYVDVNPAFCALTGYSREELLSMEVADVAASDPQRDDVAIRFGEFLGSGTESGTFTLRHKDGHVVEAEYRAVADIQPGVHLSVLRDVTGRNSMLRALIVAEAEFRELAENATEIVVQLRADLDGRLRVDYINPASTAILGYPRERFYDDPNMLLDLFDEGSDGLDEIRAVLPTLDDPTREATLQVRRADGSLVWLEVYSTLTNPNTIPATVQLVARDVTTRSEMMQALEQTLEDQVKAAEQLRMVDAMKDTFLRNVSHELRTPLTSILGFAQLLADPDRGLSPARTRHFHQRILANAERLHGLLEDVLDVDRLAHGEVQPKRLPTDLGELIVRTVHDIELGDHPVDLDLEPITMDLDETLIKQLVANMLRNVVRHTPRDAHVWVRTRATTDGGVVIVDDDGPGIPEADRQRLLQPFRQGEQSASSARPGMGIGLSLVNTFARLHGGGLTITESPAGGARMTVTLKRSDQRSRSPTRIPAPTSRSPGQHGPRADPEGASARARSNHPRGSRTPTGPRQPRSG